MIRERVDQRKVVRGNDAGPELRVTQDYVDRLEGWCDRVAERSGVDRDRIWRWAYLERVATGLHVLAAHP